MAEPVLGDKEYLTPEETISLFALSRRKFRAWLYSVHDYPLIAQVWQRKLIHRTLFAEYLCEHSELRRREKL